MHGGISQSLEDLNRIKVERRGRLAVLLQLGQASAPVLRRHRAWNTLPPSLSTTLVFDLTSDVTSWGDQPDGLTGQSPTSHSWKVYPTFTALLTVLNTHGYLMKTCLPTMKGSQQGSVSALVVMELPMEPPALSAGPITYEVPNTYLLDE